MMVGAAAACFDRCCGDGGHNKSPVAAATTTTMTWKKQKKILKKDSSLSNFELLHRWYRYYHHYHYHQSGYIGNITTVVAVALFLLLSSVLLSCFHPLDLFFVLPSPKRVIKGASGFVPPNDICKNERKPQASWAENGKMQKGGERGAGSGERGIRGV